MPQRIVLFNISDPNALNIFSNTYSFLSNIQDNKIFRGAKIEGADAARILQRAIGLPSSAHSKSIVKGNQLLNFTITVYDIDRSDEIHGPQVATLKGKSILERPGHKENITRVPFMLPIEKEYRNTFFF